MSRWPSLQERFWSKVQKVEGGCWLWTGKLSAGYGALTEAGEEIKAHRFSWELAHGSILNNLWVLHKCDVRNCVNPEHLFLGTIQDNVADMVQKGRNARHHGENNPHTRFTDAAILAFKQDYKAKVAGLSALANKHGIPYGIAYKAAKGYSWTHIHV